MDFKNIPSGWLVFGSAIPSLSWRKRKKRIGSEMPVSESNSQILTHIDTVHFLYRYLRQATNLTQTMELLPAVPPVTG